MPGRHINDHQMRRYMTFRKASSAAARTAISVASAYRIEGDTRLPSQKRALRGRRRPDPLVAVFDSEVVPLLESATGLRAVAIWDELRRRHPELPIGTRRTLARRVRGWRAVHGADREVIFRQVHPRGQMGQPILRTPEYAQYIQWHTDVKRRPF